VLNVNICVLSQLVFKVSVVPTWLLPTKLYTITEANCHFPLVNSVSTEFWLSFLHELITRPAIARAATVKEKSIFLFFIESVSKSKKMRLL